MVMKYQYLLMGIFQKNLNNFKQTINNCLFFYAIIKKIVGADMNNKKGFTLVELLVVMVIFGIIIGLSFPALRTLQEKNNERKFTTYQDSLKASAKLYADSYDEDLFGRKEKGCACITLYELESKKLAKDIRINDVTCDTDNTFVRITKIDGNYIYTSFMGCRNDEYNIKYIYPKSDAPHTFESEGCNTICNEEVSNGIYINASPKKDANYTKMKKIKLNIQSISGINQGIEIFYAWSTSRGGSKDLTDYKKLRITAPADQKEKIANGEIITTPYTNITTPDSRTGKYYLHIRVDRLYDLYDIPWDQANGEKYLVFGPYNLDNEPPVINSYSISSINEEYNSTNPVFNMDVTDNITPKEKIEFCLSVETESNSLLYNYHLFHKNGGVEKLKATDTKVCESNSVDLNRKMYYGNIIQNITLPAITKYSNVEINHPIYINVIDEAGNSTTIDNAEYKTSPRYTLTYDSNGGEDCNQRIKRVIKKNIGDTTWGELCTPIKSTYKFGGWYTEKNGGAKVESTSSATKDLKIYAKWDGIIYKVTLDKKSGSGGTSKIYEHYNHGWYSDEAAINSIAKITIPARANYDFDGYYTGTDGSGTKIIDSAGNIVARNNIFSSNNTIYASWKAKVYTIALANNDATTNGTSKIYLKYNNGWYSDKEATTSIKKITIPLRYYPNPLDVDYIFKGYKNGTTVIIDASGNIKAGKKAFTSNTTLQASWSKQGWQLTNPNELDSNWHPLKKQKWAYWQDGVKSTGWKYLCPGNYECSSNNHAWWYFDINGYALIGWHKINGEIYYFTDYDPDGNNAVNCEMRENTTSYFKGHGYSHFDKSGACRKGWYDGKNCTYCGGY